jgi:hypothetical protein
LPDPPACDPLGVVWLVDIEPDDEIVGPCFAAVRLNGRVRSEAPTPEDEKWVDGVVMVVVEDCDEDIDGGCLSSSGK